MENSFLGSTLFIFLIILVLITIFGIFYMYFTTRNRERMALIEKGMNPNLANSDFWLIVALIAMGIPLGLLFSGWISSDAGPLWGFFMAGLNIVIYYFIKSRRSKKLDS